MADILLITDIELTKGSPLGGSVDIDKYRTLIKEAQVFILEPILGTKLFDKILTDFDAATITGVYSTIHVDYLKSILIYSAAAEYVIIGWFEVNNAGIFRRLPEDTQPAAKNEIDFLASKLRAKADVYIERLQRYLSLNQANIPEYTAAQDNTWDIKKDKSVNTYGGWHLGNKWGNMTSAEQEIWKDIYFDEGR